MHRLIIALFLSVAAFCSIAQVTTDDILVFEEFEHLAPYFEDDGPTKLINFWATWCGPCVKEMPYITGLREHYNEEELEIVLVSLDFGKDIERRVIPYLNKHAITEQVILLLDDKMHIWVDQIDPQWSGSIPLTCLVDNDTYRCYEQEFHSTDEIIELIEKIK